MQSLAEECTPLKQRYDSCFNLWFEGYLQPALDAAGLGGRPPMPNGANGEGGGSGAASSSSSSSSTASSDAGSTSSHAGATQPRRLVTSWAYSSAFRRRPAQTPAAADDMIGASHVHFDLEEDDSDPLDTTGMTRPEAKAAQYERQCGKVWREYQGCLRKAIGQNQNLTQLLEQAREEHPLHSLDGLEGSAWDPSSRSE